MFEPNEQVMFFCEDKLPGKWVSGKYLRQKQWPLSVHEISYQNRVLDILAKDVRKLTKINQDQIEDFAKQNLNSLVKLFDEIKSVLKLDEVIGNVVVDVNEKTITLSRSNIIIRPGSFLQQSIGRFMEVPCWQVVCVQTLDAIQYEPATADENEIGHSNDNKRIVRMAINKSMDDLIEDFIESTDYIDAH